VRGDFADNVALCTEDQTFELKEMEGSNAYMLSFDMQLPEASENQSYYSTKATVDSTSAYVNVYSHFSWSLCSTRTSALGICLSHSREGYVPSWISTYSICTTTKGMRHPAGTVVVYYWDGVYSILV
jgi:hypothetical protein